MTIFCQQRVQEHEGGVKNRQISVKVFKNDPYLIKILEIFNNKNWQNIFTKIEYIHCQHSADRTSNQSIPTIARLYLNLSLICQQNHKVEEDSIRHKIVTFRDLTKGN